MKHIRFTILLASIASMLPLALLAQTASTDLTAPLPFDTSVRMGKLPNGLTYYIRHNSEPEHRAELRLVIHAGSVLEDDDQQGLAHLNEHMCFNGTVEFPHNTLESFLEEHGARFGADLNAQTGFDATIYKETLPTDQGNILDSGIDILGEWAHNVTFDSIEVEKERGVVGEEWRMGRGAFERIYNKQAPIIFAGSEYAKRSPIGLKAVIDTAHRSTVMRFYHDWYRPDLMAVVVVGDFDADKMVEKIKALFTPLSNPPDERPRIEHAIPPHSETYVAVNTDKEMPQTIFSMMFVRPEEYQTTVADYRKDLITTLYDQMLNARIQEAIQKGEAPFAFAGARDGGFVGRSSAYSIFALLRQDSVQAGVKSVLSTVYRAKETGFTASELDRAKKTLLSQMEKQWEERDKTKSADFVREYISNFTDKEPSPGIDYEYAIYKQYVPGITLDEVNAMSSKLMDHASPVMTFEGPESPDFTPPTQTALLGILSSVQSEHLAAYEDNTPTTPLMASQPKPGKIISEKKLASIGVTVWQLSNGARVIVKPTDFKDDEILFHAVAPGGSSIAPDAEYLSAQMSDNIVENSGLATYDATTVTKILAGKEVDVSPFVSSLQQGLDGHSTKKDLETMFQLAHLYMTEPRYDSTAAGVFIAQQKAVLQNMHKMPEMAYNDTMQVTMSQYNYRSRPQTAELMDEVNTTKAYDYYKQLFGDASGFTFYFVGNIDTQKLRPMVETYLASLPSTTEHASWHDLGITPPKGIIVKAVYSGTEPKSVVSLVYTGHKKFSRENRFKLSAMSQAFQMVLLDDIREDKSGVYYVRVTPSFQKYPRDEYKITINFGCDPARVDELVAEVRKDLDTLTSQPLGGTYVERVHKILTNELQVNMRENKYWMTQLQDAFWNDLDPNTITESSTMIDAITPHMVFETAKEYFDPNNCMQFVLYPEKNHRLQTPLSRQLGIRYPIIQAGMVWTSGWKLAVASARAGALGLIGAGSMKPELLREHIRKAKATEVADIIGVNLPLIRGDVDALVQTVIEEMITIVFTSAGNPKAHTEKLKAAGCFVAHVIASVKHARKAEDAGCDAVVAEGFEAGGHNGIDEITTLCLVPQIVDAINIPVIAAGGIADGRQLLACLALGAQAVQIGTRFAATVESSSHPRYKQAVIESEDNATVLVLKKIAPVRLKKNQFSLSAFEAQQHGATKEEEIELLGHKREKLGIFEGDLEQGELEMGQSSGLVKEICSCEEVIQHLLREFEEARRNLRAIHRSE